MPPAVHAPEREAHDLRRRWHVAALTVAPPPEPGADVARLEPERFADALERERPLTGLGGEPLLGLVEESLPAPTRRRHVLLERADRVLEDREHEPLLRLQRGVDLDAVEELGRKDRLRLEAGAVRFFELPGCLDLHRCLLPVRARKQAACHAGNRCRATPERRPSRTTVKHA